jgi:hypothetical protein
MEFIINNSQILYKGKFMKIKNLLCVLFVLQLSFLPSCFAKEEPAKVVYKDPIIKRADIINDNEPGLTPFVVKAPNGDLIAGWDTGRGDIMPGGEIHFARSTDLGKTWQKPYLKLKATNHLPAFLLGFITFRMETGLSDG